MATELSREARTSYQLSPWEVIDSLIALVASFVAVILVAVSTGLVFSFFVWLILWPVGVGVLSLVGPWGYDTDALIWLAAGLSAGAAAAVVLPIFVFLTLREWWSTARRSDW